VTHGVKALMAQVVVGVTDEGIQSWCRPWSCRHQSLPLSKKNRAAILRSHAEALSSESRGSRRDCRYRSMRARSSSAFKPRSRWGIDRAIHLRVVSKESLCEGVDLVLGSVPGQLRTPSPSESVWSIHSSASPLQLVRDERPSCPRCLSGDVDEFEVERVYGGDPGIDCRVRLHI